MENKKGKKSHKVGYDKSKNNKKKTTQARNNNFNKNNKKANKDINKVKLNDNHNEVNNNYDDCGIMIYDLDKQKVHSGGSGCGCLPSVAFSYIINQLKSKTIKKVLLLATGALHNPSMLNQKESIPSICHAISMEVD